MTQLTQKYISLPVLSLPVQTAPFVKPLTYEFRVAEFVDDSGKIERVNLQMQVYEHDEYGAGIVKMFWHDVPRVKISADGNIL